ncbi:Imm1 family immunity protein [Umezawaea sp. Da 62-37]|uniref:Imm1 family immunity protein n=1 Tax=Umezawaea sp. Da 62-37 TaxID=3075927 RepID=UPI0037DD2B7B
MNIPDRMFELDVSRRRDVGALLYRGPDENLPAGGDPMANLGSWTTRADVLAEGCGLLFIDEAIRTEFPADAMVPLDIVRQALLEFRVTGTRPTCMTWQKSDVY